MVRSRLTCWRYCDIRLFSSIPPIKSLSSPELYHNISSSSSTEATKSRSTLTSRSTPPPPPSSSPSSLNAFLNKGNQNHFYTHPSIQSPSPPPPTSRAFIPSAARELISTLHHNLGQNLYLQAWSNYTNIYREGFIRYLHPEDHSAILGSLTLHYSPKIAAHRARLIEEDLVKRKTFQFCLRDYHNIMIIHLANNNNIQLVLETFECIESRSRLVPDMRAYTILLASLSVDRKIKHAEAVYQEMIDRIPGSSTNGDAGAIMVEAYGRANDVQGALKLSRQLLSNDPRFKDRRIFEALIKSYGYNNMVVEALAVFDEMVERERVQPDLESFDALMQVYATNLDHPTSLDSAFDVWIQCKKWCESSTRSSLAVKTDISEEQKSAVQAREAAEASNMFYEYITDQDGEFRNKILSEIDFSFEAPTATRHYRWARQRVPLQTTYSHMLRILFNSLKCTTIVHTTTNDKESRLQQMIPLFVLFREMVQNHQSPMAEPFEVMLEALHFCGQQDLLNSWLEKYNEYGFK